MKSLHQFMFDKNLHLALRVDQNPPSEMIVDVKTTQSDKVKYKLISIPMYLTSMIHRIIDKDLSA